jgi:lysozyme
LESNSNLFELIKKHEGLRLEAYKDMLGFWTIGYGHKLEEYIAPITEVEADIWLSEDIVTAVHGALRLWSQLYNFTANRQNALIDLVFNIGVGGVQKFVHMLMAIQEGDWNRAALELQNSLWFKQVGARGPELVSMLRNG